MINHHYHHDHHHRRRHHHHDHRHRHREHQHQGCVSLLKPKSGFLIRKQIFRFFTKIQKRITDPNDPQRR